MNESQRILLVRHGETAWSRSGRHTSTTDIPLTGAGEEQAIEVGRRLRSSGFAPEQVITSPMQRSQETCRLAGFAAGAQVSEDLREWDYGAYEGRTTADIREDVAGWTLWDSDCPGGETASAVGQRTDRLVTQLRDSATDGDVLLFGHGHQLRVLAARWCGLPPADGRLFALAPASLSILGYERETAVVERWNQPGG